MEKAGQVNRKNKIRPGINLFINELTPEKLNL